MYVVFVCMFVVFGDARNVMYWDVVRCMHVCMQCMRVLLYVRYVCVYVMYVCVYVCNALRCGVM